MEEKRKLSPFPWRRSQWSESTLQQGFWDNPGCQLCKQFVLDKKCLSSVWNIQWFTWSAFSLGLLGNRLTSKGSLYSSQWQGQGLGQENLVRRRWAHQHHVWTGIRREISGLSNDGQKGLPSPGRMPNAFIMGKTSISRAHGTQFQARETLWGCWVLLSLRCSFYLDDKWKDWEREVKRLKTRRVRAQKKLQKRWTPWL